MGAIMRWGRCLCSFVWAVHDPSLLPQTNKGTEKGLVVVASQIRTTCLSVVKNCCQSLESMGKDRTVLLGRNIL